MLNLFSCSFLFFVLFLPKSSTLLKNEVNNNENAYNDNDDRYNQKNESLYNFTKYVNEIMTYYSNYGYCFFIFIYYTYIS